MISTAFIYLSGILLSMVLTALSLLDFLALPDLSAYVSSANSYLDKIDTFLPITHIVVVIIWIITYETLIFSFFVFRWIMNFVPGIRVK